MSNIHTWASRLPFWIQVTRLDRPVGWILLLWPTWIALVVAGHLGNHNLKLWFIFTLGTIITRSAGCIVNDWVDRDIDRYVKRTRFRPLTSGDLKSKEAFWLALGLLMAAFGLVLFTNAETIGLSIIALFLAVLYPWLKRVTFWPQLGLGLAFSMTIPMAFTAHNVSLSVATLSLFLANIFWTISYDTFYAMVDRDDDLAIGIKSTAIQFGNYDLLAIGICQISSLILFTYGFWKANLNILFLLGVIGAACFAIHHQVIAKDRSRENCFRAFLENHRFGASLFLGACLGLL